MFCFLVSFLSKPFRPVHVYYYDDHHYHCFVLLSVDLCIFHEVMNKAHKLGFIQVVLCKKGSMGTLVSLNFSLYLENQLMLCLSKMLILALLCHRSCLTLASKHILDSADNALHNGSKQRCECTQKNFEDNLKWSLRLCWELVCASFCDHILLAVWIWMCPGLHWTIANYSPDPMCNHKMPQAKCYILF